MPKITPMTYK